MISFLFRVNESFRGYPSHPITIPKSQVNYADVDRLTAGATHITVQFPNKGRIPARILCGVAGYGEYRQIRTSLPAGWPIAIARQGQLVDVQMMRLENHVEITVQAR